MLEQAKAALHAEAHIRLGQNSVDAIMQMLEAWLMC